MLSVAQQAAAQADEIIGQSCSVPLFFKQPHIKPNCYMEWLENILLFKIINFSWLCTHNAGNTTGNSVQMIVQYFREPDNIFMHGISYLFCNIWINVQGKDPSHNEHQRAHNMIYTHVVLSEVSSPVSSHKSGAVIKLCYLFLKYTDKKIAIWVYHVTVLIIWPLSY